jgi:hypothetical protein
MTTHTRTACPDCRLAEAAARSAWIAGHIHQVRPGQWVVAQRDARSATWTASMAPRSRRLTGCSQVSSRTLYGIADDGTVATYASRASALRSCRLSLEAEAMGALCAAHRAELLAALDAEREREIAEDVARFWGKSV